MNPRIEAVNPSSQPTIVVLEPQVNLESSLLVQDRVARNGVGATLQDVHERLRGIHLRERGRPLGVARRGKRRPGTGQLKFAVSVDREQRLVLVEVTAAYDLGQRERIIKGIPNAHIRFFDKLRLCHETDQYIFVHAGLKSNIPLKDQDQLDMLWIRDEFIYSDFDFGKRVIFGHTPFRQPLVLDNKIGIDTGAVYGNKLTCVELPAVKFYSV